ncbi:MAG: prolyl oligopeptidase family serine peptidase [Vicinamibacterales bacterium]|nr:prolyl oligopeptidase family serine peptidase [Vicinamibacterales bacterium]
MALPALFKESLVAGAVVSAVAVLSACAAEEPGVNVPPPPTETREVVETLHGVEIRDPYRWLEDQEAPETRAWIDEQNSYTDTLLEPLPGRESLESLAGKVLEVDAIGLPNERGGRYFYSKRRADQDLSVLYVRDGIDGDDRVLIDPHPMSPNHTTSVSYLDISRDGRLVVYAVRDGGVDEVSIHLLDVDTGEDLDDMLPEARYGNVNLTRDKTGFYYERYGDVTPKVMFHALGTDPGTDTQLFGDGYDLHHIPVSLLSDDGRWLLVHVIEGSSGPTEIHLKDLTTEAPFTTVIKDGVSESWAEFAGDQIVITTNLDAPNKRVVVADPGNPAVDQWREIIPERKDVVIQGARGLGGQLAVSYLQDVQPRVAIHDLSGAGVRDITFETLGSVGGGTGRWTSDEAFFTFQSYHRPNTIYRYDLETGAQTVWAQVDVPIDTDRYEVTQTWFASKDGTRVPMFVTHRADVVLDGTNPTLLTGYGGFNLSRTPAFSSLAAVWLESGGVFAEANMRGGGEFGEDWHRDGMLANKQNVFDDFIAAAEHLVAEGYTSPEHLALRGGSNGGLLVGTVSNQRPDLFGAVVCTYPLLDMVRYHQFLVASFWVPEYGSSEDPEQFAYIHAYSPYHNVDETARYPATLYITGDGDTRVAPLHGRKMAALMQATHGAATPVLLRYHTDAGHSGGQPVSQQIEEMVDTVSFLLWQVG